MADRCALQRSVFQLQTIEEKTKAETDAKHFGCVGFDDRLVRAYRHVNSLTRK